MATTPTGLMKILTRPTYFDFYLNKTSARITSLSGHYKTQDNTGNAFYKFKFATHEGFRYSNFPDGTAGLRVFIEDLYGRTGTENEELIALFDDDERTYDLTTYNGALSVSQTNQLKVVTASTGASNITINTASVSDSPTGLLFKKGDFLQPLGPSENYRYPYQVTEDVTYADNSNIIVNINRPIIAQTGVTLEGGTGPNYSGGVAVGKKVRFVIKVVSLPTYSVVPHDRVRFNGDFELIEVIL